VANHSHTATFAAICLYIDNWRWQDVPFYLRSGKALADRTSEIVIEFNRPPHVMFDLPPDSRLTPNILTLSIQPDEGMHLSFEAKVPGSPEATRSVDMEFHYSDAFDGAELPEAYERLLLDAISGDASLFARSDEIERAWALIDPVLAAWKTPDAPALETYPRGQWGPKSAENLVRRSGRCWWTGNHDLRH
jgi:glucose-6-phosphate 1-dehydrogenase